MDDDVIRRKIMEGMPFGLFERGSKCYFHDGTRVSFTRLTRVLQQIHGDAANGKTLAELCPDSFEGNFKYKVFWHRWKKRGHVFRRMLRTVFSTAEQ